MDGDLIASGLGGDLAWLLTLAGNPVVGVLAWVLPVAIELLAFAWCLRAWRRYRRGVAARAWELPAGSDRSPDHHR